ncbi:MAG: TIGR03960 family B12-binding radical SAM protein [Oscillospiraceae bacterium]|nr:TIGR03960 family B12-binding radical SAM protein [Oscillospiraceae bacterium]
MCVENLEKILLSVQRPARYTGGEVNSVVKDVQNISLRFAFAFPDIYDIGMSHLGLKILYSLINSREGYWCERVFMPLPDMAEKMREHNIPLYALESGQAIRDFDIIGFTLQYELSYTTILAMLDLAGIPVLKSDRGCDFPLIIAGGPCACNPEPLCDFIDLFVIGEGEEVTFELLDLYNKCDNREDFLGKAALIDGIYVPDISKTTKKRIIADLDNIFYPKEFIVPFIETVHDRAVTEVLRGCIRGCRFCQAGFTCRPYREKPRGKILNETMDLCKSTGYDEVSLCSLSTSDYSDIEQLLKDLTEYTDNNKINLSLPSLRIDKFNDEVLRRIKSIRKSGLTFAPEAGTQRLRNVINKNITEENILTGCRIAFSGGYSSVKLYFMLGLPTETDEDIIAIYKLTEKIMRLYKEISVARKGISVSISLGTFVPKPFTPFQYEPMISREQADKRQKLFMSLVKSGKVKVSRSDYSMSLLEAVFARGDRRLGKVIHSAFKNGCVLDAWNDYFDYEKWEKAFREHNITPEEYACRSYDYNEPLPWGNIDMSVSEEFLVRENKRAHSEQTTPNCREACTKCGLNCEG